MLCFGPWVPFERIVVATDFSPTAQRAVETAVDLARQFGASLTLLHVIEIPAYVYLGAGVTPIDMLTPVREAAEQALADALAELRARMPGTTSMQRSGDAADQILGAIGETHADLVVLGTHGRRGVSHMLMGSVAERVVRTSPVPVLTVRVAS